MKTKKDIKLKDINVNKIVASNKIKVNDEIDEIFIFYIMDNDVIPFSFIVAANEWLDKVF